MGGKGGGKKGPDWSQIFTWAADFAYKGWEALKGFWQVITPLINTIKDLWGYVVKVYDWAKAAIQPLWDFYKDQIKPWLDWVRDMLENTRTILLAAQGKLDELWNKLLNDVLGPLNDIIKDVTKIWTQIADVVSVFNASLAEKMLALESDLTAKYNAAIDAVYDKTIGQVKEILDIPLRKLNELEALYNLYVKTFTDKLEHIGNIIETTFEKPDVLKRTVIWETSMHWGVDLWNDLFSGVTPKVPATPSPEMQQLQVDPFIDKYIEDIFAEKVPGWEDLTKRIDEEIREKFYGEIIPQKTTITVPKLPGGAGGGY